MTQPFDHQDEQQWRDKFANIVNGERTTEGNGFVNFATGLTFILILLIVASLLLWALITVWGWILA